MYTGVTNALELILTGLIYCMDKNKHVFVINTWPFNALK